MNIAILLLVAGFALVLFRVLLNGFRSARRPVPVRVRAKRRHMQKGP